MTTAPNPMWVVFWTRRISEREGTRDSYAIVPTEEEAKALYEVWTRSARTLCGGYAPISVGTEPHWVDQS